MKRELLHKGNNGSILRSPESLRTLQMSLRACVCVYVLVLSLYVCRRRTRNTRNKTLTRYGIVSPRVYLRYFGVEPSQF